MADFVFSPEWFFSFDVLIDFVSFITLLAIALISFRFYRLDREKRLPLYLSLAFGVLAASFAAKLTTYMLIYFYQYLHLTDISAVSQVVNTRVAGTRPSYWLFSLGVSFYHLVHLTGLYMLYCIYQERLIRSDALIVLAAFFIITYFSHNSYFAFHIMALVVLALISNIYFETYQRNRKRTTLFLMVGFGIIAVSQAFFVFKTMASFIYVLAQIIQSIGYIFLLVTIVRVLIPHGKKEK